MTFTNPTYGDLLEALRAEQLAQDMKHEHYRQSDRGLPPSGAWGIVTYDQVTLARRGADELREKVLQGAWHFRDRSKDTELRQGVLK